MNTILYEFSKKNLMYLPGLWVGCLALAVFQGQPIAIRSFVSMPMVFAMIWVIEGVMYFYKWRRRHAELGHAPAIWDEREEAVYYKALAWGFGSSWIALVLAVGWFIQRYLSPGPEEVTMVSLSVILGLCFCVLVLFFSLSVIAQKRGEEELDA